MESSLSDIIERHASKTVRVRVERLGHGRYTYLGRADNGESWNLCQDALGTIHNKAEIIREASRRWGSKVILDFSTAGKFS